MDKLGNIGIFDSGIGGITVLKEIVKIMPKENYIYYSDSKNNPYGDKGQDEIKKICDNIVKKLIDKNCKVIVIACNTASAIAKDYLREKFKKVPIIAIEPAYKMVYDYSYNTTTLVMATKGTIESEKFKLLLTKYNNNKTYLLACMGLADLIEEGNKEKINKYLNKNLDKYKNRVESVVLGCTHYPLIQEEIKNFLGDVNFFNGAPNLAKHLKDVLEEKELINNGDGKIEFIDSKNSEKNKQRFFEILKNNYII